MITEHLTDQSMLAEAAAESIYRMDTESINCFPTLLDGSHDEAFGAMMRMQITKYLTCFSIMNPS